MDAGLTGLAEGREGLVGPFDHPMMTVADDRLGNGLSEPSTASDRGVTVDLERRWEA